MVLCMSERDLLMVPGPTMVDPAVLRSMSKPTESHLHAEFSSRFKHALENLKKVFMTKNDVFAIAGSGTLAQEMGVANLIETGDRVLCLVDGFFSGRFVEIVKRHKGLPHVHEVEWGKPVLPSEIAKLLEEKKYKAVTASHVETSTGVAIPIEEIGRLVMDSGAYFILDTVASLGGMEVRTDDWGIDANCTCTQKCLATPPGLAFVSLSRRAEEYLEKRKEPIGMFYGDLKSWLPVMRDPMKYLATPPVNLVYGLDESLNMILSEGLEKRFARHASIAKAFRRAMEAIGLRLVAHEDYASKTVTTVFYPQGFNDADFRSEVFRRGVVIARGFGPFEGKIFRVGHMGNVTANDIMATICAIEIAMKKSGHSFTLGAGAKAAEQALE